MAELLTDRQAEFLMPLFRREVDEEELTDAHRAIQADPAMLADAEARMQAYTRNKLSTRMEQGTRAMFKAPGAMLSQFMAGAQDALYGLSTFGLDVVAASAADGSDFEAKTRATRERIDAERKGLEAAHQTKRLETLGQQPAHIELLTGTLPEMGGQMMPFMVNPAIATSTLPRAMAYNAAVGGVSATALDKDAENLNDRMGELSWGALAGATITGVLSSKTAIRNRVARRLRDDLNKDLAQSNLALEKEVQRITGDLDFNFSAGDLTGNPFLKGLETAAKGELTRNARNTRINRLVDAIRIRANNFSSKGSPDSIAADLNVTIRNANKELQSRASENFSTGINNVIDTAGDQPIINGRTYLHRVDELISEYSDPTLGGNNAPAFLLKQREQLVNQVYPSKLRIASDGRYQLLRRDSEKVLGNFDSPAEASQAMVRYNELNGGIDAETTSNLLRSFRRISSGEVPVFDSAAPGSNQNLSLALKKAMLDSMDDGAVNKEAADAIKSLRQIYAFDQAQIAGINNRLMAGVFGVDDISALDAKAAWNTFRGKSVEAQKATAQILEELNPALLDDIRGQALRDVVNRSFVPGQQQSLTAYNPTRLAQELALDTGTEGGAMRGLFNSKDALELRRVGQALRTINETAGGAFESAAATQVENASINVISRSPEFLARWMSGVMIRGSTMERALQDPAMRQAIINVADTSVTGAKRQAAMLYIAITTADWMAADEAKERSDRNTKEAGEFAETAFERGSIQ